jgi:hypothetical protein
MLAHGLWIGLCLAALDVPLLAPSDAAHSPAVALRIESLTRQPVLVQVTSTPPGLWPGSGDVFGAQAEVLIRTPAVVNVADSVRFVRVTVRAFGAVRIHLEGGASPEERRLAPWGRDVTLSRIDGHFRPVWRVHPLP